MLNYRRHAASAAVVALLTGMLVVTSQTATADVREGVVTTTAGGHTVTATVSVGDASVPQWGKTIEIRVDYASPTAAVSAEDSVNSVVVTHRASGARETAMLFHTGTEQVAEIATNGTLTGRFDVDLRATAEVAGETATFEEERVTSFMITRETRPWITVWPGMPADGATYKVSGGLEWFAERTYLPGKAAPVSLWFTPKGSTRAIHKKALRLDSRGTFSVPFKNNGPGTWEMRFAGGERYAPSSASVTMTNFSRGTHTATYTQEVNGTRFSATVKASDVTMTLGGATMTVDVQYRHNGTSVVWDKDGFLESRNVHHQTVQGSLEQVSGGHYTGKIRFRPFTAAGMHSVGAITDAKVFYGPAEDDYDWHFLGEEAVTPFVIRRKTLLNTGLSTSTPARGQEYVVKGSLRKLWVSQYNRASYKPAANATVRLYFDPAGSTPRQYVRSVKTTEGGRFSARVKATRSGVWTAKYAGTTMTYLGSTDTARVAIR